MAARCRWMQIGEGVTRVKPGQRVVPQVWLPAHWGNSSWQEFVSVKEEWVIPIPDSISDEVAAQFIGTPWTAIGMLRDQDVPKGEYLLQNAAGSALGRYVEESCDSVRRYHDREGVTEQFIKNGMKKFEECSSDTGVSNFGRGGKSWVYEVEIHSQLRFVEMYLKFPEGFNLSRYHGNIKPGERVLMEIPRKFSGRYPEHEIAKITSTNFTAIEELYKHR